jgi:hypothetical protein
MRKACSPFCRYFSIYHWIRGEHFIAVKICNMTVERRCSKLWTVRMNVGNIGPPRASGQLDQPIRAVVALALSILQSHRRKRRHNGPLPRGVGQSCSSEPSMRGSICPISLLMSVWSRSNPAMAMPRSVAAIIARNAISC